MTRVLDKVALITGAGRGQGRSHAVRLAEEGADIIALDICAPVDGINYPMATPEDLELTRELVEKTGRRIVTAEVDIRERHALGEAVDAGVAELGGLDIVVANAGVATIAHWNEFPQAQWDAVIGTNITGTWNTLQATVPHLLERGAGSVIATASTAGLVGMPFLEPYAASKHAVIGLIRSLSIELAEQNIRFNAVCPTGVSGTGLDNSPGGEVIAAASERVRSAYLNAFEIQTVQTIDVSNAVLYLASDESRYVTGTAMSVDAGLVVL
ncbi:mycofactocin-coupled SDR family oxidoreductase [Kribbella sp. NPDC051770]|uniref:mycofactocin-coupled SDR family oxidoreductase n=1 Tax=Kribbella sp. NPDC051770 TaxID=3155413 RepID=UPI00343B5316